MSAFRVVILSQSDCKKSKRLKRKLMEESFASRQKARQWCRNHYWSFGGSAILIVRPDGTEEHFVWNGTELRVTM